jgi:hypothetical protein
MEEVRLEKPTVAHLVKKFPKLYGITRAHYDVHQTRWTLS